MGIFSSLAKMIVYPVARPLRDIKASGAGIKDAMSKAKEAQRQREADAVAATEYLKDKAPREKFDEIFNLNGWTEPELAKQAKAARNTRIGMVVLAVVGMLLLFYVMASLPTWALAIIGPVTVILMAGCCALAARFAWWEAQIAEREIYPMRDFLGRKDFFRKVFFR